MNATELKRYKEILIETLNAFNAFCEANDIKYFASGGTAIGAVRHKGFIPWDDDIDVCMLREDYEKFLSLKDKLKNGKYCICDYRDEGYCVPSAKFIDTETSLWEVSYHPIMLGAYIDIFPLDFVTGTLDEITTLAHSYRKAWDNYSRSLPYHYIPVIFDYIKKGNLRTAWKRIQDTFYYSFFKNASFNKFKQIEDKVKTLDGDRVLMYNTFYPIRKELIRLEAISEVIEVPFENTTIKLPKGYHEYLTNLFGDYMQLPPKEKQVSHHAHVYLNLDKHVTLEQCRKEKNIKY